MHALARTYTRARTTFSARAPSALRTGGGCGAGATHPAVGLPGADQGGGARLQHGRLPARPPFTAALAVVVVAAGADKQADRPTKGKAAG